MKKRRIILKTRPRYTKRRRRSQRGGLIPGLIPFIGSIAQSIFG